MTRLSGGEALATMFERHGITMAFGIGGFQLLPYYDAIGRRGSIRHVLVRDEKHGGFAADGFARLANRPAIADATLGPGATNLVSAAAEMQGAGLPGILLTGEVNSGISGRGATQESDQFHMIAPACKASITVHRVDRIPELVRRACAIATAGKPGPVNLNIPEDVCHDTYDFADGELRAHDQATAAGAIRVRPDPELVERAAQELANAQRPVIVVGGGVHLSEAHAELEAFVALTGMPVASTISGKGAIAETNPASLGIVGRYSKFANDMVKEADVLLVIGCKLGEIATSRWTLLSEATRIIHIDIDPLETQKVHPALTLWGDARLALRDLREALEGRPAQDTDRPATQAIEVAERRARWTSAMSAELNSDDVPISMARVVHTLNQVLPPDAVVIAEGGFSSHWSALLYDTKVAGRSYIANRGHAAIGYGLPAAIGAQLAAPERPVVALCGDGGFGMAVGELETAVREGLPIVAMVINNMAMGYVKALQHGVFDGRYVSSDLSDTDYGYVGRAFGCEGARVDRPDELAVAVKSALGSGAPTVLDVRTTTDPSRMLPGEDPRSVKDEQ